MDASDWDGRYAGADLVWSAEPNVWVHGLRPPLTPGRALDLAAGEGRNALWLVEQGWTVTATDFSPVAVTRMGELADRRLATADRARLEAVVADATAPAPGTAYDLVLFSYLHLPREEWERALSAGVAATAPGGSGGRRGARSPQPHRGRRRAQDAAILLDPEDLVASSAGLPVAVELAQVRSRAVEGAPRPALDTVAAAAPDP